MKRIRWKSALLGGILAVSGTLVAAQPAQAVTPASGFIAVGTIYEHYNYGGSSRGLFVNDACDFQGFTFDLKAMYAGFANWAHIVSSVYLTGNGGCTGIKLYARDNPAVTWVCTTCAGKILNIGGGFNDNVGKIRVFRV